jgi:hypothetical protein
VNAGEQAPVWALTPAGASRRIEAERLPPRRPLRDLQLVAFCELEAAKQCLHGGAADRPPGVGGDRDHVLHEQIWSDSPGLAMRYGAQDARCFRIVFG